MMDVENQKSSDSIRSFALLALGEIGQHVDLAAFERLEMVSLIHASLVAWQCYG